MIAMRHVILAALLLAPALAHADGRDWQPARFDRIESAGSFDVSVVPGPRASVRAEGERDELARLRVGVDDGRLTLGYERGGSWSWHSHGRVRITITTPTPIRGALLSGSGNIVVARVDAPAFKAEIAGSGDIRLDSVDTRALSASIAGSGNITATGHAARVSGDVAGSGNLRFADLRAEDLSGSIAGSGDLTAFATRTASLSIMGSGNARVRGGARCSVSKMGSGRADCGA